MTTLGTGATVTACRCAASTARATRLLIAAHYAQFRDLGVDFLVMDDTNTIGNDGGRINDNIRAWIDFMDAKPAAQRIPICIGGGGEMRSEGKTGQKRAADFYWAAWACRPSYFRLQGKPLLLVDTDKNYGPGDFDDTRFTVRWVYNGDNHAAMKSRRTWGWGAYEPPPLQECMSIWPGHRYPGYVASLGNDPVEAPRQGGQLYVRQWLNVLKTRPQFVTVADWNNFEEETAVEDSASGRTAAVSPCPTSTGGLPAPTRGSATARWSRASTTVAKPARTSISLTAGR